GRRSAVKARLLAPAVRVGGRGPPLTRSCAAPILRPRDRLLRTWVPRRTDRAAGRPGRAALRGPAALPSVLRLVAGRAATGAFPGSPSGVRPLGGRHARPRGPP